MVTVSSPLVERFEFKPSPGQCVFLDKTLLLLATCYGNRDKHRPDGPVGSYAEFTFHLHGVTVTELNT